MVKIKINRDINAKVVENLLLLKLIHLFIIQKKDITIWIQYLECLFAQNSLKDCAEKCKISVSTAFFWRHRILDAIREITNKQVLKDKIQCDETYFNESFKGNHKNSKFVMPRKPHKRGISCHLRGISHQKVCVLTALDNSNILYAAPITMGRPASSDLIRVLQNRLKSSLYFSPCFIFYLFILIIKLICTCICFNICIYYYYIPNNYLRTTNC